MKPFDTARQLWSGARLALCLCLLLALFPAVAQADMGPKPQITVVVEHPPQGEYYLDLLVPEGDYDNLGDRRAQYDPQKLALLADYREGGWHAGLTVGTRAPMWGDLRGEARGEGRRHTFGYFGVPDRFKLLIATPEGELRVSDWVDRVTFQTTLTYDYQTGQMARPSIWLAYLRQFAVTLLPTLLIEGVLLLAFRFPLKKNGLVFLLVNLGTQLFLTATLGRQLLLHGLIAGYAALVPLELAVAGAETLLYLYLLRGQGRGRRVAYALTANAASALAGWLLLKWEFWLHFSS